MEPQRVCALFVGLWTALLSNTVSAWDDEARCSEVNFSVFLDDSTSNAYRLAGQLCRPTHGREASALQLLIHGATYNRIYWDFPLMPRHYSYVRHANRAGFATLAIDRLGAGASDHPPAELVTVSASAKTIHQIVSALRSGTVRDTEGRPLLFRYILLVGHSFGSNIAWVEAGTYGDVDGLIVTGISHDLNPPGVAMAFDHSWPAELDPTFADAGFPEGYFTTTPGSRAELFYYSAGADAAVIDMDEATKDVVPAGMFTDQFSWYGLTQAIHVPVLNVNGDFDTLACQLPSCTETGGLADEESYYPADTCFTQLIIPNAGHDLNLHRNAPSWYWRAQIWARTLVETDRDHRWWRRCPGF